MKVAYFQSLCKIIGLESCYFLCILDIAEEINNKDYTFEEVVKLIKVFTDKHWMKFDFSNLDDRVNNFYILEPLKILSYLCPQKKFTFESVKAPYKIKDKEHAIEFWSIDGKTGHFARTYRNFNSLQKSKNVENGKIISYRIFREVI